MLATLPGAIDRDKPARAGEQADEVLGAIGYTGEQIEGVAQVRSHRLSGAPHDQYRSGSAAPV